jgi:hypothetical protein
MTASTPALDGLSTDDASGTVDLAGSLVPETSDGTQTQVAPVATEARRSRRRRGAETPAQRNVARGRGTHTHDREETLT